ncbi:MAG: hypothetical protein JNJ57_19265 [Saprospiraceae bacterium]|nr:hypothetical protein [Saprospiraceae bacterium]
MSFIKVVLTEPFVRLPATLVLELDATVGVSGWNDDERARERMSFMNKKCYSLPDGGNGTAYELPLHYIRPCPEGVFEGVDLNSGPVRITASTLDGHSGQSPAVTNLKFDAVLWAKNDNPGQGILFTQAQLGGWPETIEFTDRRSNSQLQPPECKGGLVDLSLLPPGFYELILKVEGMGTHRLRLIKSFPLLIEFEGNSQRYRTQKTLY